MPAQKNRNRLQTSTDAKPQVHRVGGRELAQHLMNPQRAKAAVVISYLPEVTLRMDADQLAARVGKDADVYELANGNETRKLESGLPEKLHVFGNGVRIYPNGPHWPQRIARVHLLHHHSQLPELYEKVAKEVLYAQAPANLTGAVPVPLSVEAVVIGFPFQDRAMVEVVPGGARAMVHGEDLFPGIPLEWIMSKGQRITGIFDPLTRRLDIKELLLPRPSPVTVYKPGDVALARVSTVCPTQAVVQLWPGSAFHINAPSISSNDLDSLQDLLTEDEVVLVRVGYNNGAVRLSMLDVDDDEPIVPAPALVRGGPPWLDLNRPYASIPSASAPVAEPGPAMACRENQGQLAVVVPENGGPPLNSAERRTALQSTQWELERARHIIDELMSAAKKQGATEQVAKALQDQLGKDRAAAAGLARMLNAAEHQIDALKDELAKTKASLVQLRQQRRSEGSRSGRAGEDMFLEAAERFSFELQYAWAAAVPAVEKAAHPLGKFHSSQHFLEAWAALTAQQRGKTLRAVVDLVADRRGPLRKREPHPLRLNEGAHAGPTLRGDDVCMRLYVEKKTPGALRLHYWKSPSGGLELHDVVNHDVVKP